MESKFGIIVLCALSAFVQAVPSTLEETAKYWKCHTYADCHSDEGRQKLSDSLNKLKPEEIHSMYDNIQNKCYDWKSNDMFGGRLEYCNMDEAEMPRAFIESNRCNLQKRQKACADPNNVDGCKRHKAYWSSYFEYLDQLEQQGLCSFDV